MKFCFFSLKKLTWFYLFYFFYLVLLSCLTPRPFVGARPPNKLVFIALVRWWPQNNIACRGDDRNWIYPCMHSTFVCCCVQQLHMHAHMCCADCRRISFAIFVAFPPLQWRCGAMSAAPTRCGTPGTPMALQLGGPRCSQTQLTCLSWSPCDFTRVDLYVLPRKRLHTLLRESSCWRMGIRRQWLTRRNVIKCFLHSRCAAW